MITAIIGNAPFAVSIVLTVFMGGLGFGSYLASRFVDRFRTPGNMVLFYGVLELIIGFYSLVLPFMLKVFGHFFSGIYNQLFSHFWLYNGLTFIGCSFVLFLP